MFRRLRWKWKWIPMRNQYDHLFYCAKTCMTNAIIRSIERHLFHFDGYKKSLNTIMYSIVTCMYDCCLPLFCDAIINSSIQCN